MNSLTNSSLARIQEFRTSCCLTTRSTRLGLQELSRDDADPDSPAKAFRHENQGPARMLMETPTARERLDQRARFNCIEIETVAMGNGCMCGEEICVEREIEPAVHRFLGESVQDLLLYRMAPRFGCQWEDDFGSVRASKFVKQPTMNLWGPNCCPRPFAPVAHGCPIPQTLTEAVDVSAE